MVNTAFDPSRANLKGNLSLETLTIGAAVDVRTRYVGAWTSGFVIADVLRDGYRIRRLSDGSLLPGLFEDEDVRAERHKSGLWW